MSNYLVFWDETNKKWRYSVDGAAAADLVENPTHETATWNGVAAPTGISSKSITWHDSTANQLKIKENNGNALLLVPRWCLYAGFVDPNGISTAPGTLYVVRSPYNLTLQNAYAQKQGGTNAVVNAGSSGAFRSANLTLTTANWTSFGTLQNTSVTAGNSIYIQVVSVSGAVTQVFLTLEFTREQ